MSRAGFASASASRSGSRTTRTRRALAEWRLGAGVGARDARPVHARYRGRRRHRARRAPVPRLGGARARRRRRRRRAVPGLVSRPGPSGVRRLGARCRPRRAGALRRGRRCPRARRAREAGEPEAVASVTRIGHFVGIAVGSLANIFDPELFIVGGGFGAAAGELLLEAARGDGPARGDHACRCQASGRAGDAR